MCSDSNCPWPFNCGKNVEEIVGKSDIVKLVKAINFGEETSSDKDDLKDFYFHEKADYKEFQKDEEPPNEDSNLKQPFETFDVNEQQLYENLDSNKQQLEETSDVTNAQETIYTLSDINGNTTDSSSDDDSNSSKSV